MSTKIDNTTGLPTPPKGFIWEVTFTPETYFDEPALVVALVRANWFSRKFGGATHRLGVHLRYDDTGAPVESKDYARLVLHQAQKLMERYEDEHRDEVIIQSLIGLYPPKRLVIND